MTKRHQGPSQRQLRMGEEIRHRLSAFLQRHTLRDPILEESLLSVSEVQMSPDLKLANCFIIPLDSTKANAPEKQDIIAALNRHAKYIRGQMAQTLRHLRSQPEFRFRLDTSFDNFAKIDALLRSPEVVRDLELDTEDKTGNKDKQISRPVSRQNKD